MSKRKNSQLYQPSSKMAFTATRSAASIASPLIAFYEGTGADHRGRTLATMLGWNESKLESCHDYIQTMFPLPEPSNIGWNSPVITRQVFDAFRSRPELREALRRSFKKILWFYGFEWVTGSDGVKVSKAANYLQQSYHWNVTSDHNHLRISRIIRCLRVLGLEDEALAFRYALEQNATKVGSRSREFWRRATERSLNLRPDLHIDEEDDDTIGPRYLCEFEQRRNAAKYHTESAEKADEAEADTTKTASEITSADAKLGPA